MEHKFKVGDRVRRMKHPPYELSSGTMQVGREYVIRELGPRGYIMGEGADGAAHSKYFQLVTNPLPEPRGFAPKSREPRAGDVYRGRNYMFFAHGDGRFSNWGSHETVSSLSALSNLRLDTSKGLTTCPYDAAWEYVGSINDLTAATCCAKLEKETADDVAPKSGTLIAVGDTVVHISTGDTYRVSSTNGHLIGVSGHCGLVFASDFSRFEADVAPKSSSPLLQPILERDPMWLHRMYGMTAGLDGSDTSRTNSPVGENNMEELMKKFETGSRVYRLGDGWTKGKHGDEGTVLGTNSSGSLIVQMDNGHKTPNGKSTSFALVTQKTAGKGTNMSDFNVEIATQTTVNGRVITDQTPDNDLLGVISQAEAEIAKLEKMGTKPRLVVKRIESLKAGIVGVVEILDARTPEAESDDS